MQVEGTRGGYQEVDVQALAIAVFKDEKGDDGFLKELDARTVGDLLKTLGLHRDAHLVVRGEDILTTDVRLAAGDEVEVWPVISGGT